MSAELLHLVVAALRPDASDADRDHATSLAGDLAGIDGVVACIVGRVVGRSDTALTTAVWIDRRDRIEGFAAAPEHMRFVIEGLARTTTGMWSASVALPPAAPPPGAARALWAFALPAEPPAFEWEAQELLEAITGLGAGDSSITTFAGPTVEERERFRAGGVVLAANEDAEALSRRIDAARAGWGRLAERLQSAVTPVVR